MSFIPRATYRLQFTKDFGFATAAELAPYLATLGVSHVYASPFLKARPGSTHGYDIVDYAALNPELGSEEHFRTMVKAFKSHDLGIILDFVPNHMGVGGADNEWWLDVLEWGPNSTYAGYFDIDWKSDHEYLRGKVLVPLLGKQYGEVLGDGDLQLRFEKDGTLSVWAYDTHRLPICPFDYGAVLGSDHPELERLGDAFANVHNHAPNVARRARDLKAKLSQAAASSVDVDTAVRSAVNAVNSNADALDELIHKQHWRPAFFQVAADDINYRRFFNINELAGVRMEEPELFNRAHQFVFGLIADGTLDGLRIDHIDGLLDPKGYCVRLREEASKPFYFVVEKILARHEHLRTDWPVHGTTGYEFANLVGGLLVDPAGGEALTRIYRDFTRQASDFGEVVRACKLRIMETEMASELHTLARSAARIARSNRNTCDFTANILHSALKEVVARFPVYRTYVDSHGASDEDRRDIEWAIAQARKSPAAPDASVFDFVERLLTTDLVKEPKSGFSEEAVVRFAMKLQQYSGPVMAKGLEDTAFYRFNRLVSLNEVGGHPDHFGVSVASFHQANSARQQHWPHAMLSTSTHDTKRGEDTRCRLHALSEIPDEWETHVNTWSRLIRARRGDIESVAAPDRNDEYLLYQLFLGAWPADMTGVMPLDPASVNAFGRRVEAAMIKSIREAKLNSTWAKPNGGYEQALKEYLWDCLDIERPNAFLDSFRPFQARVARMGFLNSLWQIIFKFTVPGVPDIYQGTEFWDLTLVDPDNRRPVDYTRRREAQKHLESSFSVTDWDDGTSKFGLISALLQLRASEPDLFSEGSYEPLRINGLRSEAACAFLRRHGSSSVMVVVPRFSSGRENTDWGDTSIDAPCIEGSTWRDLFGGDEHRPATGALRMSDVLCRRPFAVLTA